MSNGFPRYVQELVKTHEGCGKAWIGEPEQCPYCNKQRHVMTEEEREGSQKLAKKLAQRPGGETPWRTESIVPDQNR